MNQLRIYALSKLNLWLEIYEIIAGKMNGARMKDAKVI